MFVYVKKLMCVSYMIKLPKSDNVTELILFGQIKKDLYFLFHASVTMCDFYQQTHLFLY